MSLPPLPPQSPFRTTQLIRHTWRWRWVLIPTLPIFIVLAYFWVRTFLGEVYESTAVLRVRTPPSAMRLGPNLDDLEPPVYEDIFLNNQVLMEVTEAARARFPQFPKGNFEELRKSYEVEVVTTRETVVVAEYSPLCHMRVRSGSPEWAHFLMTTWLEKTLQRFGKMRSSEAAQVITTFQEQYNSFNREADSLQAREAELQHRLLNLGQKISLHYASLKGSSTARTTAGEGETVSLSTGGLYQESINMEMALAGIPTGEMASPEATATRARLEKARQFIDAAEKDIEELGKAKVQVAVELEKVREDLLLYREKIQQVREVLATTTPDAQVLTDSLNEKVQGDFSVMAWPVMPEKRIAPPRAVYAIAIGLVAWLLLFGAILVQYFVRVSLETEKTA